MVDDTNINILPPEPEPTPAPAPATTRDMLDSVNSAILAIAVGGQSYRIGSRQLTRADLKQLYAIKNDLTAQLASENNNSGLLDDCYVAVFDGR